MMVYKSLLEKKLPPPPRPSVRCKKELITVQIVWDEKDTRVCLS